MVFKYLNLRETKARFNLTTIDSVSSTSKSPFMTLEDKIYLLYFLSKLNRIE